MLRKTSLIAVVKKEASIMRIKKLIALGLASVMMFMTPCSAFAMWKGKPEVRSAPKGGFLVTHYDDRTGRPTRTERCGMGPMPWESRHKGTIFMNGIGSKISRGRRLVLQRRG